MGTKPFRCLVNALLVCVALPAAAATPDTQDPAKTDKAAAKSDKPEASWNVAEPPGPQTMATIDVSQGTWMAVDVSPDGKELAFDLLGDIYTLPITGGEAKPLLTGVPWEMQPRYSPDGQWIAFTSDRGGGDNLWIVRRDGTKPQAVSKEDFRLANSPAWSPDGQWLVGRKHFSSERSLGTGELWLWHRSGGGGLQLTKKTNDQKDLGEPVFSPDGRYVYFSLDATPGPTFQYNKDSNDEIYQIRRLDRMTGEIDTIVSGPGGACRPTPSPDGTKLAYVKRVRFVSTLFVRDLKTGTDRVVYAPMERDLQETWAIHGVYPGMAWTPDSQSLVFWASGTLHKVSLGGEHRDIPFHVRGTRQVTQAVRFPVEVAPARFPLKILRWVAVSPNDKQVLYQALGQLWLKDLPSGTPRRLTSGEAFAYYPTFSRDGKWIVYSTFDDPVLGRIRVIPAGGGKPRTLVEEAGHYLESAVSPDGRFVVYRKSRGTWLRGRAGGQEPGLYVVPFTGGTPKRLTKDGYAPQFGAEADRVYFTRIQDEDRRALVSLELDGSDERTHATSEAATEFRLSPDGKWLAFTERFNVHVTPFVPTGKAVEVGPKMTSVPVMRVSKDAGENIHFSGDSARLHWSLGPELFTRELKDAFAFMAGAPEKLPEPPAHGTPIGFDVNADVPAASYALVGGRVISMRGDEVLEDGVVVVEQNRIRAVGRRGAVAIPAGAKVIDISGKTVIPGLVDVHWHGAMGADEILPRSSYVNYASLAFGVTTLHDPSNDTSQIFAAAELARAGEIVAPRIFSTGTVLYGAKAPFQAIIDSLDDARAHLKRQKAYGAFSVKSYNQPRRNQRQQVIAAARELGMVVVPEGGSLFHHNMTQVVDGHTGIEHSIPQAVLYDDVRQLWSQTQVGYTPTLVVAYGGLAGEMYWYAKTNVWEDERLMRFVPRELVDAVARRRTLAPDNEWNHIAVAREAKELMRRGVSVQIGAHGQREGLGAHWEMWSFVQGGMTPHEALRVATLNGARYLGLDRDIGSLEAGKLADLVVLDKNPLLEIRNTESIALVMINGRIYDGKTMDEIGATPKKRRPLWFER